MIIVKMMIISYLVTVIVETIAALIWKIKDIKLLAGILLVNTITNPLINIICFISCLRMPHVYANGFEYLIEVAVFLIEGLLFWKVLKLKYPFLVSLSLNAASYGIGMLINWFINHCLPIIIGI